MCVCVQSSGTFAFGANRDRPCKLCSCPQRRKQSRPDAVAWTLEPGYVLVKSETKFTKAFHWLRRDREAAEIVVQPGCGPGRVLMGNLIYTRPSQNVQSSERRGEGRRRSL